MRALTKNLRCREREPASIGTIIQRFRDGGERDSSALLAGHLRSSPHVLRHRLLVTGEVQFGPISLSRGSIADNLATMNSHRIPTARYIARALPISLTALAGLHLHAQAPAGVPTSQAPIREQYELHDKAAAAARTAGDWATVRRHASAVDTLFNGNPSTLMVIARASARLGDTAAALATVRSVVSMGVIRNLAGDPDLAPLRDLPEWKSLVSQNESNARPIGAPAKLFTMPEADFIAEDIVWDAARNRYLVSSVRKGTIVQVSADGTQTRFLQKAPDVWGIFALGLDTARSRLWATTVAMSYVEGYAAADSAKSAVLRYDLKTGALVKRYDLARTARGNSPGDVAVAPNGDLYVSDSRSGILYTIRAATDSLEILVPAGTFMSPQGPAVSPDGKAVYVADYVRGLAEVSIPSGKVRWLSHDRNVALSGIDGLTFAGPGRLVAIQNGLLPHRLMVLGLDAVAGRITSAKVIAQDSASIHEPTHGIVRGANFHFIANAGWDGFDDKGAILKDNPPVSPVIMSIKLDL